MTMTNEELLEELKEYFEEHLANILQQLKVLLDRLPVPEEEPEGEE